jgi:hypothetical protein
MLASVAFALSSDTLPTGEFEDAEGPGGYLVISSDAHNKLAFQLVNNGANGHSCGLAGNIEGNQGRTKPRLGLGVCMINFHADSNAITVEVDGADGNFEAYLPTAKTTWYIRKHCNGEEHRVP